MLKYLLNNVLIRTKNNYIMYVLNSSLNSENNKSYSIHFTKEYDKFKFIKGNRVINYSHVEALIKSIKRNGYLMNPVFINEKQEIIDGQHRYYALRELKMEIPFLVLSGYNGKEMQVLNQTASNWSHRDFMLYWNSQDFNDYKILTDFVGTYDMLGLTNCVYILSEIAITVKTIDENKISYNSFDQGEWNIKSLKDGIDMAEWLINIKAFHAGFKNLNFIKAILYLENKYPMTFFRSEYARKLRQYKDYKSLEGVQPFNNHIEEIEMVYNHKRKIKDSINMTWKEY